MEVGHLRESPFGAARAFTEQMLGGPVNEIETTPSIGNSASEAVKFSPDRVGLAMINLGTTNINVALQSAVGSTLGILLGSSGGFITLNVTTDFTLPARSWWAIVPAGAASTLYILELVRITYASRPG